MPATMKPGIDRLVARFGLSEASATTGQCWTTPLARASAQKSGLSARGTMESVPPGSSGFSAHIRSVRGLTAGR